MYWIRVGTLLLGGDRLTWCCYGSAGSVSAWGFEAQGLSKWYSGIFASKLEVCRRSRDSGLGCLLKTCSGMCNTGACRRWRNAWITQRPGQSFGFTRAGLPVASRWLTYIVTAQVCSFWRVLPRRLGSITRTLRSSTREVSSLIRIGCISRQASTRICLF